MPVVIEGVTEAIFVLYLEHGHRRDEQEVWFLESVAGAVAGAIQRHRAAEALQISEARHRSILRFAADAIISADERGRILDFNPAAEAMFGYQAGEIFGQPLSVLMAPDIAGAHAGYMARYKQTGEARIMRRTHHTVAQHASGRTFPIALSLSEVQLPGGRLYTGIIRDISEQQRTREELVLAREAAEEASKAKSMFLASMSHEIRTPMNGIIGMSELLMQSALTPSQQSIAQTIVSSGNTLLQLLNDILDFSKLEAGQVELEWVPTDLHALLHELIALHQPIAAHKGLSLELSLPAGLPVWLRLEPTRLRQVILNLLSNALKFTARGSVTLSAQAAVQDDGVQLTLSVSDTGIGIPAERLSHIFDAFTQADSSTTRLYGGTGLGLSICQQLTALMGGTLKVDSAPGRGSTFSVVLPVAHAAPAAAPALAPSETHTVRPGLRVLVAEDNRVNQRVIQAQLDLLGGDVTIVANGAESVQAASQGAYGVILMDHHMPVMDGLEATRRLRAQGYTGTIIALTASALAEDAEAARLAGMNGFLSKPLKLAQLRESLASAQGA